ncbi:hypothetical protein CAEBREN_12686 [Caenorhabditis brenneri]|uniref:ribonuclease H n=1 Tax=Caenorhabditis brenneri TaxID=135651 RepID=G0P496_CAEBE|nr:hypothetical protein CAEBREN_12686 [Caenorhabditis brenneri]
MSQCPPSSGIPPQQNDIIEDLEILSRNVSDLIPLRSSTYSPMLLDIAEKLRILTSEIEKLEPSQLNPIAQLLENRKVRARVWTDGSCYNQGFAEPRAAFGVFWGEGHPNNHNGKITGVNDSTRAELFAACYAIKQALDQDYFAIKLHSDCRFVEEVIKRPSHFMSGFHF